MPGTQSLNFTQAQAFKDYVEDMSAELYSLMYFGFPTANSATVMDGIKGKTNITELVIGELSRRWNCNFEAVQDAIDFIPRTIETTLQKVDLAICVQDFEKSYLGEMRKKGQDPKDFPFERFILDKVVQKLAQEIEVAVWQAKAAAVPAVGDLTKETFDGFHPIMDTIIAGGLPVYAMGTGANIVEDMENMSSLIGDAYDAMNFSAFISKNTYKDYYTTYRGLHPNWSQGNVSSYQDIKLDIGNVTLKYRPGYGVTDRIIMTPDNNLVVAVDAVEDASTINVQEDKRVTNFWIDYRLGAQIAMIDEKVLIVNDQPGPA